MQKYFLIASAVLIINTSACKSSDDDDSSSEKADATAAVAAEIAILGAEIYNANWVGQTCTTVSKTANCSAAGTVAITGSFSCTTSDAGVQTMNLDFSYDMTACTITNQNISVVLTGTMTHSGTSTNVNSVITAETITFRATTPVTITATGASYKDFASDCTFAVVTKKADVASEATISGSLCDVGL